MYIKRTFKEYDDEYEEEEEVTHLLLSREEVEARVLSVDPIDPQRLCTIDPEFGMMLKTWVRDGSCSRSPGYDRRHNVFATEIAMVELSDLKVMQRFVNVVKIGVTQEYQRLGIASAILDYLLYLLRQGSKLRWSQLVIESVISKGMRMLLEKRSDCYVKYTNSFVFLL